MLPLEVFWVHSYEDLFQSKLIVIKVSKIDRIHTPGNFLFVFHKLCSHVHDLWQFVWIIISRLYVLPMEYSLTSSIRTCILNRVLFVWQLPGDWGGGDLLKLCSATPLCHSHQSNWSVAKAVSAITHESPYSTLNFVSGEGAAELFFFYCYWQTNSATNLDLSE